LVKDEQPIGPAGFPAAKTKGNQEETDEAVISGRTRILRTGQAGPFLAAWNATVLLHHGTASRHVEGIFCTSFVTTGTECKILINFVAKLVRRKQNCAKYL